MKKQLTTSRACNALIPAGRRLTVLVAVFLLISSVTMNAQDSLLMKLAVKPPASVQPAKAATATFDGQTAVYNTKMGRYELMVPLNKLLNMEVSMEGAETARFGYYSRYFQSATEQVLVQLGEKGCLYLHSGLQVRPLMPDYSRIMIIENDSSKKEKLTNLIKLLDLVPDTLRPGKQQVLHHGDAPVYPIAWKRRNGKSFLKVGDSLINRIEEEGYAIGLVSKQGPAAGFTIHTFPVSVRLTSNAGVQELQQLLKTVQLKIVSEDERLKIYRLDRESGTHVGMGLIDLVNKLGESPWVLWAEPSAVASPSYFEGK